MKMMSARNWSETSGLVPGNGTIWETGTGQGCLPWAVLPMDRREVFGDWHWLQFCSTLPPVVREPAQALGDDLFSALELFLEVPAAMDLVKRDRVLALALSRHWEFPAVGCVDWEAVRQNVCRRRRDIISWLGYPARESTVKALQRVRVEGFDCAIKIQRALAVLSDPDYGPALAHIAHIDQFMINRLSNPLTRQWIDLVWLKKTGARIARWCMSHWEEINDLFAAGIIEVSEARQLSKRNLSHRSILPYLKTYTFTPAPVPAFSGIEHLDRAEALIREGEEMCHCAGSMFYQTQSSDGVVALYRVLSPVRATLALRRGTVGVWEFDSIKGPHNANLAPKEIEQIARAFPTVVRFQSCYVEHSERT